MDQAKSLKKSLAQTDAALKKSQDGGAKLDAELTNTLAKAEGLQMRVRHPCFYVPHHVGRRFRK